MDTAAEKTSRASAIGVSFRDLLAYNHDEMRAWTEWLRAHPDALEVNVGGQFGKLQELFLHTVQTEFYFAARLFGENPPDEDYEAKTLDGIWALHEKAHARLSAYIERATEDELDLTEKMPFDSKPVVTRRKMLAQAFLHGIHHRAQMAMEVRQAGIQNERLTDYILSPVVK